MAGAAGSAQPSWRRRDATRGPAYRGDIDGLRAVAVLGVICFHAWPSALRGGFTGVDVFFVISGFLITALLLHELESGRVDLGNFYARRARRLLPALLPVLVALLVFGWLALPPDEYAQLGAHVAAGIAFLSNYLLWREVGYFDAVAASKPLLHLWSLAIEAQFYLVWPVLLIWASKSKLDLRAWIAALALCTFVASVVLLDPGRGGAFYSPLSRAWEFMAGAWLATAATRSGSRAPRGADLLSILGLVLIAAGFVAAGHEDAFPGWWALFPVVGAFMVIAAGESAWLNRKVLSHPWTVGLGLISYPLYLWHWVALYVNSTVFDYPPSRWSRAVAIGVSVALAAITYLAIEVPVRSRRAVSFGALTGSAIMALMAGAAIYAMAGVPDRLSDPLRRLLVRADSGTEPVARWCSANDREAATMACRREPNRPLFVVWGDSHAARLAVGLNEFARSQGADFIGFVAVSCPPLRGFPSNGRGDCPGINEQAIAEILAARPDLIVLNARWDATPYNLQRLADTAAALKDLKHRIVVVGPAPRWNGALARTMMLCHGRLPDAQLARWAKCGLDPGVKTIDAEMAARTRALGLAYVSAYDILCNSSGCMRFTEGADSELTTHDYGHLSAGAAHYLVGQAAAQLRGVAAQPP